MTQVSYHGPSAPLNLLCCVCCRVGSLARNAGYASMARDGGRGQLMFGCLGFPFFMGNHPYSLTSQGQESEMGDGLLEGLSRVWEWLA